MRETENRPKVINKSFKDVSELSYYNSHHHIRAYLLDAGMFIGPDKIGEIQPLGRALALNMYRNGLPFVVASDIPNDTKRMMTMSAGLEKIMPSWKAAKTSITKVGTRPGITLEVLDAVSSRFHLQQKYLGYVGLSTTYTQVLESDFGLAVFAHANIADEQTQEE